MSKVLYITNIAGKKMTGSFSGSAITAAKQLGIEFFFAANREKTSKEQMLEDEKRFQVHLCHVEMDRSPFSLSNITAYRQLKKIIQDNRIDYIHCNTPVGGLLGRLAGQKCKVKKVIYQAHGFHFYQGAPKKNWLLYYPIEKWLAHKTDAMITINKEDYELACKKLRLRNHGKVYYIPGVGIDLSQYSQRDDTIRFAKRKELGLRDEDVVLISAGELNKNKNNKVIIEALKNAKNAENVHYMLCGVGEEEEALRKMSGEMQDRVHFLGYRTDMKELLQAADIFVMPSFREGLSRSIMEAMAAGLPCIVSEIRGNVDMIDEHGGCLCRPKDTAAFAKAIERLASSEELRDSMGAYNREKVKQFGVEQVCSALTAIYQEQFQ